MSLGVDVARTLDGLLVAVCVEARLLPALTAINAVEERKRLIGALDRGQMPTPAWQLPLRVRSSRAENMIKEARALAANSPASALYDKRLEELELDLAILHALPDARRVRTLAARRFGTGASKVTTESGEVAVSAIARHILDSVPADPETDFLPADAREGPSCAQIVRQVAHAAGLQVDVRIEPRLAAAAATGEKLIFLADRRFGVREAVRVAVHEVLAHLTAAANGRSQPLRILELGTAGSFVDQEGVALHLEWESGFFDGRRLRILAARVVATDRMHAGASFAEVARDLIRDEGFASADAVAIAERAFRGGGVARDAGYLRGLIRVRHAIRSGAVTLDELRLGRVGIDDLEVLRRLKNEGLVREPHYRASLEVVKVPYVGVPSFFSNLSLTPGGTSLDTSPPNLAASLTRFELT
ncbi:MAG: DUF1704 domain-containing protein [Sandaracinaceae bacterium]|nr:DUF1704 domain-containing protein [Sandaracinaceae bacterium]